MFNKIICIIIEKKIVKITNLTVKPITLVQQNVYSN